MKSVLIALACVLTAQNAMAMNASEIAGVAMSINNSQINVGKIVPQQAKNPEIIQYGQMMVKQYEDNLKQLQNLIQASNIQIVESQISKSFEIEAQNKQDKLKDLEGEQFDNAFIDSQIAIQEAALVVLQIIDENQPELANYLVESRRMISENLSYAKRFKPVVPPSDDDRDEEPTNDNDSSDTDMDSDSGSQAAMN